MIRSKICVLCVFNRIVFLLVHYAFFFCLFSLFMYFLFLHLLHKVPTLVDKGLYRLNVGTVGGLSPIKAVYFGQEVDSNVINVLLIL